MLRSGLDSSRLFAFLFVGAFAGGIVWSLVGTDGQEAGDVGQAYSDDLESRSELVMIYIGSPNCPASSSEEVKELVASLRSHYRDLAEKQDAAFVTVGVAVNWLVDEGLEHLERVGPFDQIAAGGSWVNELAFDYLWGDLAGEASTPQVVVIKRDRVAPSDNESLAVYSMKNVRVIRRAVGVNEIRRIANSSYGREAS